MILQLHSVIRCSQGVWGSFNLEVACAGLLFRVGLPFLVYACVSLSDIPKISRSTQAKTQSKLRVYGSRPLIDYRSGKPLKKIRVDTAKATDSRIQTG